MQPLKVKLSFNVVTIMNGSDVKKLRARMHLSQSEFCQRYRVNIFTLRQWERKDTVLDTTASAYLTCISNDPTMVHKLLNEPKKRALKK